MYGITKPGTYSIPEAEYHADPCPSPSLSSSVARILFERSPEHAMLAHPRLNEDFMEKKQSREMAIGSAAHKVIFESSWASLAFVEFDNWRTTASREASAEAIKHGMIALLPHERAAVEGMVSKIKLDEILEGQDAPKFESTLAWKEGVSWYRARPDIITTEHDHIYDFKTTGLAATPSGWGRSQMWEYAMQAGFYRRGYRALFDKNPTWTFVVQERTPPYSFAKFEFDHAGNEYCDKIAEYSAYTWDQCLRKNTWLSYSPGVNVINAPYNVMEELEREKT